MMLAEMRMLARRLRELRGPQDRDEAERLLSDYRVADLAAKRRYVERTSRERARERRWLAHDAKLRSV